MSEGALIADLGVHQLLAANAAVAAAATVQFVTGSGFGILAAPLLLLVSVQFLPGPLLLVTFAVMLFSFLQDRLRKGEFALGTAAALGVPCALLGAWLSTVTDPLVMGLAVGTSILVGSVAALAGRALRPSRGALASAGGVGGVLAGLAAVPGPPVVLVYRDRDARRYRGNLSLYFLIVCLASAGALLLGGGSAGVGGMAVLGAALMPGALLGALAAWPLRARLRAGALRPCSLALSGAAGLAVLMRTAIG